MADTELTCPGCGKPIPIEEDMPKALFCPYCGSRLEETKKIPTILDDNTDITFTSEETTPPENNTQFCSPEGELIYTGWLPTSYTPSAKYERNNDTLELWAYAQKDNTSWFYRNIKKYSINKFTTTENPFRSFDTYLDEKASEILETADIHLIKRVLPLKESIQRIRDGLINIRKQLDSLNQTSHIRYVMQAQYGADGAKIYEADSNGKKKYLLLKVAMTANEYGTYTPNQSQYSTDKKFNSPVSSPFQKINLTPDIDTDPNTPIGMHNTNGLSTNTLSWELYGYCGLLSNSPFTKDEIKEFFMSINSLKTVKTS